MYKLLVVLLMLLANFSYSLSKKYFQDIRWKNGTAGVKKLEQKSVLIKKTDSGKKTATFHMEFQKKAFGFTTHAKYTFSRKLKQLKYISAFYYKNKIEYKEEKASRKIHALIYKKLTSLLGKPLKRPFKERQYKGMWHVIKSVWVYRRSIIYLEFSKYLTSKEFIIEIILVPYHRSKVEQYR